MIKLEISGANLISAAMSSPYVQVQSIRTNSYFYEKLNLARWRHKIKVEKLNQTKDHQRGREHVQATIAYNPLTQYDEELFAQSSTVVYLDHLNDPQNLGNALRHALAFEADAVIVPEHKACPLNETVARASVGALFTLPIFCICGTGTFLQRMKKDGYGVIGAALEGQIGLGDDIFWPKSVIAIGSEGSGLRPSTRKLADCLVKIDHSSKIDSLNAATTATLLCYERYRQKKANVR